MAGKLGRYLFVAEQYQCNVRTQLRMGYLINSILTAADYHATQRGFGTDRLNPDGKTWVLSRFALEMDRIPFRHEAFYVETWVESVSKFFTNRNFRIVSAGRTSRCEKEGAPLSCGSSGAREILGYGRSIWAMIDTASRRPVDLTESYGGRIADYIVTPADIAGVMSHAGLPDADRESLMALDSISRCVTTPIEKPSRIPMNDGAVLAREVRTYFSDVDFNGHINSVRYIDHILDLFSVKWHKAHCISRLDITFVAEGKGEEPIKIFASEPKSVKVRSMNCAESSDAMEYSFRIVQQEDHETSRCRLIVRDFLPGN